MSCSPPGLVLMAPICDTCLSVSLHMCACMHMHVHARVCICAHVGITMYLWRSEDNLWSLVSPSTTWGLGLNSGLVISTFFFFYLLSLQLQISSWCPVGISAHTVTICFSSCVSLSQPPGQKPGYSSRFFSHASLPISVVTPCEGVSLSHQLKTLWLAFVI